MTSPLTRWILGMMLGALLFGCGSNDWTQEQISEQVALCTAELTATPARATPQKAKRSCSCYFDEVRSRWGYEQYLADAESIASQLEQEGTLDACLK